MYLTEVLCLLLCPFLLVSIIYFNVQSMREPEKKCFPVIKKSIYLWLIIYSESCTIQSLRTKRWVRHICFRNKQWALFTNQHCAWIPPTVAQKCSFLHLYQIMRTIMVVPLLNTCRFVSFSLCYKQNSLRTLMKNLSSIRYKGNLEMWQNIYRYILSNLRICRLFPSALFLIARDACL